MDKLIGEERRMYLYEEITKVASELNEKAGVLGAGTLKTGSRLKG